MRIELNGETLACSSECSRYFDCLLEGKCSRCEIERLIEGIGAYIRTPDPDPCPYKESSGDSYVCTCPTRNELFAAYGV